MIMAIHPCTMRRVLWACAGSILDSLRVFRRGASLLLVAAPATMAGYLALATLSGILPVQQVWLVKLAVDALTGPAGHPQQATGHVLVLAVLYALTFVGLTVLDPLEGMVIPVLQSRAAAEIDRRLMQAGTQLVDLARVESPTFHDDLRRVQETAFHLFWTWRRLRNGLVTALTLGGLVLLLAHLQPLLPLALAVASMPHLWAERRAAGFKLQAMADQSRAAREMDYCARIVTEAGAAKEVRVFGLGDFFLRRFQTRCETALAEINRVRLAQVRLSVACGGLYVLALGGGFWYVAAQVGAGRLALGDIALYLGAVMQAQARLSILAWVFGELHESLLQMRRLFAYLDDARPAITLAPRGEGHAAPAALHSGIALHGVRFRYPGSAEEVLHDVNALLPAGKVTALVGANGAGKSTLVKLLTRMYDPTGGTILLDARELAAYDLASLRARIAVVYQDLARFALSLGENIAVGAVALEQGAVDVEQAAHWAGADEVAARLPRGYDTQLTHQFEGGVELSGGEWQKVALARAFVRDAALVILDEPTAALDAAAEYQLFARFRDVVAGKTALLISHRFSTVRMADQILVLEGGRIVEAGSHGALVALGGRYATLYEMQAVRYRENAGAH